ncbi:transcription cofactor vestigial-like protein 4 isoform X1 [Electrophorus electricus]|uniref:Transcription cofactor vestigial-like protein 4 n=1 Tax=Electrophorus electricus TaxID=8005 RepID=A0AAY5EPF9_ELEEL|nr:transcription cofactor vestigial-like protein 4 isoform X1 [Electrophorus electricus]
MLLPRMDLLSHQFMDKMNNNIGRLHYDAYDDDSGDSRIHALSSSVGNSRTGTPISPSKRKFDEGEQVGNSHDYDNEQMTKMSRLFTSHLGNPANGDSRQETWNHCHNPFEHTSSVISGLHGNPLYAPFPIFAVEQPLALTKNNMDSTRSPILPSLGTAERQQNRPSVITCAPANNRTCNLSHCHMSPNGCTSVPANAKSKTNANTVCDPVIEEHFRRSLGDIYQEPEAASNSVSITGSVDDHFAQALGETWLQIKAKGGGSRSPESNS